MTGAWVGSTWPLWRQATEPERPFGIPECQATGNDGGHDPWGAKGILQAEHRGRGIRTGHGAVSHGQSAARDSEQHTADVSDTQAFALRLCVQLHPSRSFPETNRASNEASAMMPKPPTWMRARMAPSPKPLQYAPVSTTASPVTQTAEVAVDREGTMPVAPLSWDEGAATGGRSRPGSPRRTLSRPYGPGGRLPATATAVSSVLAPRQPFLGFASLAARPGTLCRRHAHDPAAVTLSLSCSARRVPPHRADHVTLLVR